MFKGKRTCKILKEIRAQIAAENDIAFVTSECKHQGDCAGTCPKCEAEVQYLERELEKRAKLGKAVTVAGLAATITATTLNATACDALPRTTNGDMLPDPEFAQSDGEMLPPEELTEDGEIIVEIDGMLPPPSVEDGDEDDFLSEQPSYAFLDLDLPHAPADFVEQSDHTIYDTLKETLYALGCPESEERYLFLTQWAKYHQYSSPNETSVQDVYRISYQTVDYRVYSKNLQLTFSSAGALIAATYQFIDHGEILGGEVVYVPTIYTPDNAGEFADEQQLLEAMQNFIQENEHPDENDRTVVRARWHEFYSHTYGDTDYYAIEEWRVYEQGEGLSIEALDTPRYLALQFFEDGTPKAARITEERPLASS